MSRPTTWLVLVLTVPAAALAAGCGGSGPAPPAAPAGDPPRSDAAALREAARANPTLAYWIEVNTLFYRTAPQTQQGSPRDAARAWRAMAAGVQAVRTQGVTPMVARWALDAAAVCERFADFLEYNGGAAGVIDAMVRGANGDPLGQAVEQAGALRGLQAEYSAVRQQGMRLRAEATAHYGIEFPPCAFLEVERH